MKYKSKHEGAIVPLSFDSTDDCYRGTIWISRTEKLHYIVLKYHNKYDVEVQCLELGNILHVRLGNLKIGAVKNPYFRTKYGGYFGVGPYTKHGNLKAYSTWSKILYRLDPRNQNNSRNAVYSRVSIDESWLNFQIFAEWFENYISLLNPKYYNEYQIDKDILEFGVRDKIYSPSTCCIVPEKINLALSNMDKDRNIDPDLPLGVHRNGKTPMSNSFSINLSIGGDHPYLGSFNSAEEAFKIYKKEKENYIRKIADFYYSEGAILKNIYDILYNIDIKPYKIY